MLMLIHPATGDVATLRKGESWLAVSYYRDGYRGLSERTNNALAVASERQREMARETP